ncbi:MAG TPA: LuxR family transcriptional regulator [Micromonosporaceae bacterium]|nr:LuxR family transcriptional regulator [Micromonosporaceae bacterium]
MSRETPRYVVASAAEAMSVLRQLSRDGWRTREGFVVADSAWDVSEAKLLLFGRVADVEAVRLAVLAAARGAGVVAVADPGSEVSRALIGDLARLGPVRRDADGDPRQDPQSVLGRLIPEQRALLARLANGETIAAAAAAEFLSLRTANRRIAQARQLLGVRTTREAVVAYLRERQPG